MEQIKLTPCYREWEDGISGTKALLYRLEEIPFVIFGDEAFALKNYMMRLFLQRNLAIEKMICNYRHTRGRRISENMFGIPANRWRIFQTTMDLLLLLH